jgi:hypothetical protein
MQESKGSNTIRVKNLQFNLQHVMILVDKIAKKLLLFLAYLFTFILHFIQVVLFLVENTLPAQQAQ